MSRRGVASVVGGLFLGSAVFLSVHVLLSADEVKEPPGITPEMVDSMAALPGELGALPDVPVPADNPQTPAKVELGKRLFFDVRLSLDRKTSCATCHDPQKAFGDGLTRSKGFNEVPLRRNSPTILNAAYNTAQFWDGRVATLDEQCKVPLMNADEMNMIDEQHLIVRLTSVPGYVREFQSVYGIGPSLDGVAKAIAAFERTLVTPHSRFDQYALGDKSALTGQEKRGLILFFGKAACSECHKGVNFTDNQYYNLGVKPSGDKPDWGRFEVTKNPDDKGAFKTPGLRNVALTAPYMHDGSTATLEEVVDFYDRGGGDDPRKSKLIYKLDLSAQEKADLVAFLKTLTGLVPKVEAPEMYPDSAAQASGEPVR
jgi:cytochrome c peroxidase